MSKQTCPPHDRSKPFEVKVLGSGTFPNQAAGDPFKLGPQGLLYSIIADVAQPGPSAAPSKFVERTGLADKPTASKVSVSPQLSVTADGLAVTAQPDCALAFDIEKIETLNTSSMEVNFIILLYV
jgi:hypothetical protein